MKLSTCYFVLAAGMFVFASACSKESIFQTNNGATHDTIPGWDTIPRHDTTPRHDTVPRHDTLPRHDTIPGHDTLPWHDTTPPGNPYPPDTIPHGNPNPPDTVPHGDSSWTSRTPRFRAWAPSAESLVRKGLQSGGQQWHLRLVNGTIV